MENKKIVQTFIKANQKPTKKQIKEIEDASKKDIVFDDDAPELTMEQYAQMAAIARERREQNKKTIVALRINPNTLKKAKSIGKGYTGFLSRLLDNAINDPELVSKSL